MIKFIVMNFVDSAALNVGGLAMFTINVDEGLKYLIVRVNRGEDSDHYTKDGTSVITKPSELLNDEVNSDENFLQAAIRVTLDWTQLKLDVDYEIFPIMTEIIQIKKLKKCYSSTFVDKVAFKAQYFTAFSASEKKITVGDKILTYEWLTLAKVKSLPHDTEAVNLWINMLEKIDAQLPVTMEEYKNWKYTSGHIKKVLRQGSSKKESDATERKHFEECVKDCCGVFDINEIKEKEVIEIDTTKAAKFSRYLVLWTKVSIQQAINMVNAIVDTYNNNGFCKNVKSQFKKIQKYFYRLSNDGNRLTMHRICIDTCNVMRDVVDLDQASRTSKR